MAYRVVKDGTVSNGQHQMEDNESGILDEQATDNGAYEVERKQPFKNGGP